jgi:hypothetical protein
MKLTVDCWQLAVKRRIWIAFCFLLSTCCLPSCSIPNLADPNCSEAKNAVREFYSFHFGNDMRPSPENLKLRERFLTQELFDSLSGKSESRFDYFTQTEDYPKAFRVGACKSAGADKADLQVLLFWRDDTRNEQKELGVEAVKRPERWMVNKVTGK